MKIYRSDLHVHTVLSPCAEVEMIPPLIVETAIEIGLGIIAITDHNATENIRAVQEAAQHTNLVVLPGMELQTREDVHSICLFDSLEIASAFQIVINRTLPPMLNNPEVFGEQYVVDKEGDFIRREDKMLITSSALSINEAFKIVTDMGGLFIPAHIDRKTFGLLANLGFVPPEIPFPALEISRHLTPEIARRTIPGTADTPFIQNGDVHRLSDFLGSLYFSLEKPSISEIHMALQTQNGRYFYYQQCVTRNK